jgi:hypothetical protein
MNELRRLISEAIVLGHVEGALWAGWHPGKDQKPYPHDSDVETSVLRAARSFADLYPYLSQISEIGVDMSNELDKLRRRGLARRAAIERLVDLLLQIEQNDTNYDIRYGLVFAAVHEALQAGYSAGIALDPAQPDWPLVYIQLPTGQISWHMPGFPSPYDGHTTEEKYQRIREFAYYYRGNTDPPLTKTEEKK